jgi:hypothetical protein
LWFLFCLLFSCFFPLPSFVFLYEITFAIQQDTTFSKSNMWSHLQSKTSIIQSKFNMISLFKQHMCRPWYGVQLWDVPDGEDIIDSDMTMLTTSKPKLQSFYMRLIIDIDLSDLVLHN